MDVIDASYLKTDGIDFVETGLSLTFPYSESFRNEFAELFSKGLYSKTIEHQIKIPHADAVRHLIQKNGDSKNSVDLIGFHGHTFYHKPNE